MEEPDFDDLIEDYAGDYDPETDEYEEQFALMEEFASGTVLEPHGQASTCGTLENSIDHESRSSPHDFAEDAGESNLANDSNQKDLRSYLTEQIRDENLYSFERYTKSAKWRKPFSSYQNGASDRSNFKTSETPKVKTKIPLSFAQCRKRPTNAPCAELLQSLHIRVSNCAKMCVKRYPKLPQAGRPQMAVTVADGNRLYLSIKDPSSSPKKQCSAKKLLEVHIEEIKRKADRIRREAETYFGSLPSNNAGVLGHSGELWVDKYCPASFSDLLSDERTNREVFRALRAWDPYVFGRDPPRRPTGDKYTEEGQHISGEYQNVHDKRPNERDRVILLSGPPGVGKTTLAHVLARKAGYRPFEVNASDDRSSVALMDQVLRAMESSTIPFLPSSAKTADAGRPNCIILDEIDGVDAKGGVKALVDLVRAEIPTKLGQSTRQQYLRRPIIVICNHKYATALRPLLPFVRHFNVEPPLAPRIVSRLKTILRFEGLNMATGGSLLHQLVTSSAGDIRSCLHTLQFASAQVQNSTMLSHAISSSIDGSNLKDSRNDLASAITATFTTANSSSRKKTSYGISRVFSKMGGSSDSSTTLDCLFLNLPRVPFIDPTWDRFAAAHQSLSDADLFRGDSVTSTGQMAQYGLQHLHVPSAAAALHLFCRVERKPKLSFTTLQMRESNFEKESNRGLVRQFLEGMNPLSRNIKNVNSLVTEIIPFLLLIISADPSLSRSTSNLDVLTKAERQSIDTTVSVMRSLGLTFISNKNDLSWCHPERNTDMGEPLIMRLEPPIDKLVAYESLKPLRGIPLKQIPISMKELLARQIHMTSLQKCDSGNGSSHSTINRIPRCPPSNLTSSHNVPAKGSNTKTTFPGVHQMTKYNSGSNFLGQGAKRAREAKAARKAAAIGLERANKKRCTHSGSGLLLTQVIRLRHVKGFTQAVRTPCRANDVC